jgi:hypothetical protein
MMGVLGQIDGVLRRLGSAFEGSGGVMDQLAESVIVFILTHYSVFGTDFQDPSDDTVAYFTKFDWDGVSAVSKFICFHTDRVMDESLWDDLHRYIRSTVSDVGVQKGVGDFRINFIRSGVTPPFASIVSSNNDRRRGFTLTLSTI